MVSVASSKYYEPVGTPKAILDRCDSLIHFYGRTTDISPLDPLTTKIKKYAILIFLYVPVKVLSLLRDRIVHWYGTPIPSEAYERKKDEYRQLFDFGHLENPESQIDKLVAKRLPALNFSRIYVFQIRANQSNRLFAPDGRRASDLPSLLALRDNNERVLFCAQSEIPTTMEDFWEGTLQGWDPEKRTQTWINQRCVSIIDHHSLDSLYEQLRTVSTA